MMFPSPPMNDIEESKQFNEIRKYLFRLVETMNNTIGGSTGVSTTPATQQQTQTQTSDSAYNELKALIIRNKRDTDADITALAAALANRIRPGIIRYDEDTPILGVAIGNFIAVTGETEVIDGVVYDVIDTSGDLLVWEPGKISLIVSGDETAALSASGLTLGTTTMSEAQLQELLQLIEQEV